MCKPRPDLLELGLQAVYLVSQGVVLVRDAGRIAPGCGEVLLADDELGTDVIQLFCEAVLLFGHAGGVEFGLGELLLADSELGAEVVNLGGERKVLLLEPRGLVVDRGVLGPLARVVGSGGEFPLHEVARCGDWGQTPGDGRDEADLGWVGWEGGLGFGFGGVDGALGRGGVGEDARGHWVDAWWGSGVDERGLGVLAFGPGGDSREGRHRCEWGSERSVFEVCPAVYYADCTMVECVVGMSTARYERSAAYHPDQHLSNMNSINVNQNEDHTLTRSFNAL